MSRGLPGPLARAVDAALEATIAGSFTRLGPAVRSRIAGWEEPPPAALAGRIAVVTGATSGIGEALALGLARAGASVHLVGRDQQKVARSAEAIRREVEGAVVVEQRADLARLGDVNDLARRLTGSVDAIHVLAHVAGALVHERQQTVDGIELTAQVHVVAPHLLTTELLPLLEAGHGRVITMSSGGMYTQALDVDALFDPPEPFDGTRAYAQAKRAQVALNADRARRRPDGRVGFHAMHPGWVDTPGLTGGLPGFARRLRPVLRTPAQGADTALWLAWAPEARAPGGDFWLDRRRRRTVVVPGTRPDPHEVDRLWSTVDDLAGSAS